MGGVGSMKPEDVKVGMEFSVKDISSYCGTVEGIDGEYALVRCFTCFSGESEKVLLKELANEKVFRLSMPGERGAG